ncbi:unnamed protein product [Aureobasidium vineae]|uniref:Uncharacterized protein n=1 Tax=Aureobasidium vineae TaxID=2773715 RepID=A0A9N8PH48_9PEZI|nr:unnamed protein product [Aureobasidium vineae]
MLFHGEGRLSLVKGPLIGAVAISQAQDPSRFSPLVIGVFNLKTTAQLQTLISKYKLNMPSNNSSTSSSGSNSTSNGSGSSYEGNHYCSRDYGSSAANDNSYHYSNPDGSYYYSNPNGSTYYNSGSGYSDYTPPGGK